MYVHRIGQRIVCCPYVFELLGKEPEIHEHVSLYFSTSYFGVTFLEFIHKEKDG